MSNPGIVKRLVNVSKPEVSQEGVSAINSIYVLYFIVIFIISRK